MKSKCLFLSVYILAFTVTLVNVFFSIKNYLVVDINELPKGELVSECVSPSGEKQVNVYRVENSFGTAVRGELVRKGKAQNIFWQTNIYDVSVHFGGEDTVFFNNVPVSADGKNPYDCRKGTALFTGGALEDERLKNDE